MADREVEYDAEAPEPAHPWEEFMEQDTLDPDYYEPSEE